VACLNVSKNFKFKKSSVLTFQHVMKQHISLRNNLFTYKIKNKQTTTWNNFSYQFGLFIFGPRYVFWSFNWIIQKIISDTYHLTFCHYVCHLISLPLRKDWNPYENWQNIIFELLFLGNLPWLVNHSLSKAVDLSSETIL
jgi:hypothetical protein